MSFYILPSVQTPSPMNAIECFLVEELPASIFELADRGLAHGTAAAVGKIEAPLAGLGIV